MDYKILEGKNCLVTGATGGIGQAVAFQLASHKSNLFLTATNPDKLHALQERLQHGQEIKVHYESGDLTNIQDVENIIATVRKNICTIDIIIHCAGRFIVKSLADSNMNDFTSTFDLFVRSAFLFAKEFSWDMKKVGWGRIVNIGSSSSYSGVSNTSIYCAAKHALLGFSRAIHDELKQYNIRTFSISPSGTKTRMGKLIPNQNYDTFLEPQEIAEYVAFVICYNGTMITDELRLNRLIMG